MNDITIQSNEAATLAISLSPEIIQASKDINNTLETTKAVSVRFGTHYANAADGVTGIMALVKQILKDNGAELPRTIEDDGFRNIAVACSMFTQDIIAEVAKRHEWRYKAQAVKNVLSTYCKAGGPHAIKGQGDIVKIQLSNNEDKPRPCSKPRAKYYLILKKVEPQ